MVPLWFVLVALVAGILSMLLGIHAVRNLMQAKTLKHTLPLEQLPRHLGRVVAVEGTPELLQEERGPFRFPVLWYRRTRQELRYGGRHRRWVTLDSREKTHDFSLAFPRGGRLVLRARPTEVHGGSSRVTHGRRSGQRVIQEWLPVARRLTVLGRLIHTSGGATLVPDRSAGLLFSTAPAARAARFEFLKGAGALAAIGALAAGVLVYFFHLKAAGGL